MQSALILLAFFLFQIPAVNQDGERQSQVIHRRSDIYPHPPEPQHLEPYTLDAMFEVEVKHWLWRSRKPAQGRILIEQQREHGGWWVSQARELAVDGSIRSSVQLDTSWSKPPLVLIVLLDESGQRIGSVETFPMNKAILGRILLKP